MPLRFQAVPLLCLLVIFVLFRQYIAIRFCLLRKEAEDQHRLRIEQLAREKERLEYERQLEQRLRQLAGGALTRAAEALVRARA